MKQIRRALRPSLGACLVGAAALVAGPGAAHAQVRAPSLDVAVERGELSISAPGFPLVAGADEATIVVPVEANTAAGAPNLELLFLDRGTGRVARRIEVLSVREGMRFARAGAVSSARVGAVRARAMRALDAVRALGPARPLVATPRTWPVDLGASGRVSAEVRAGGSVAYTVELGPRALRVFRGTTAQGASTELRLPTARGAGPCAPHEPLVTALYPLAGGVLVHVGFHGTDMCWEPAPTWRVVAM